MATELSTLAAQLGQTLKNHGLKLVTAESCTGGGLGYWITSIPGSSAWYERGFITYSNEAKMELLNVAAKTITKHGAVSQETAQAMAEGALHNSNADISIAITGIAGPDGGSIEKPVGTVWIGLAKTDAPTITLKNVFPGNREEIRDAAVKQALLMLLQS